MQRTFLSLRIFLPAGMVGSFVQNSFFPMKRRRPSHMRPAIPLPGDDMSRTAGPATANERQSSYRAGLDRNSDASGETAAWLTASEEVRIRSADSNE